MNETLIAAVVPTVTPMTDMGTGAQVVNASVGFMLLVTGFFLTRSAVAKKKKTLFPYTLDSSAVIKSGKAEPEIHAFLALMSFMLFGWAGTTLLLSGPGALGDVTRWLQDRVALLGENEILADAGAPGLCLILLMVAVSAKTSYLLDYISGTLAGIIWPLGGGPWLESSKAVGQLGVAVYGWMENIAAWVAGLNPLAIIGFIIACLAGSWVWRNHLGPKVAAKVGR